MLLVLAVISYSAAPLVFPLVEKAGQRAVEVKDKGLCDELQRIFRDEIG